MTHFLLQPGRGALLVAVALLLPACEGDGEGGEASAGDVRGFPDPTQAYPPRCLAGENCWTLLSTGTFTDVVPDGQGGVWATVQIGDGNYTNGDSATVGDLTAPTLGNALYGDQFITHIRQDMQADALESMGDVGPTPRLTVNADGSVAVAGDFYPELVLGDVHLSSTQYLADAFLAVREVAGGWRWIQHFPYGTLTPSFLAVGPDGLLWVTGIIHVQTTLGGETVSPGAPYAGNLFLASLDPRDGTLTSFGTYGSARPQGLAFDGDGALFLTAMGVLGAGGDFKGDPLPYPDQVVGRMDPDHEWHTIVHGVNAYIMGSLPPAITPAGPVIAVNWTTADQYITGGQMQFGDAFTLDMAVWSDAALAGLDRDSGGWLWAMTGPGHEGFISLTSESAGTFWTLAQGGTSGESGYAVGFGGICARVNTGASRGCGYPESTVTGVPTLLLTDPEHMLWMANRPGADGRLELTRMALPAN